MSFTPYSPTTWTNGVTPASQTNMNHLETSYGLAVQTLPQYSVAGYVLYGLVASKDGVTANQLDVTAGVAWLLQTDNTIAFQLIASSAGPLTTSSPTATYYLDLNPDGSYSFATSHSGVANHLTICTVATDGSGNILTVTDTRPLNGILFPASTGSVGFGLPSTGGVGFDQMGSATTRGAVAPTAPTATVLAGGSMGTGNYGYVITYVSFYGETAAGTPGTCTTTSFHNQVALTNIPVSAARGVLARNIYRTHAGGSSYWLLATLSDNTTTTYTDTVADGSLSAVINPPTHPTMGAHQWLSNAGGFQAAIYGDGAVSFDGASITSDGSGDLSALTLSAGNGLTVTNGTVSVNSGGGALIVNSDSIKSGTTYLGFKNSSNTKLAEIKASGQVVASSATPSFTTTAGSVGTASGASFDSFDISEAYPVDQAYGPGWVLCPQEGDVFGACDHDNCPAAAVTSKGGALAIGAGQFSDLSEEELAEMAARPPVEQIALAGRVYVRTHDNSIKPRDLVCSDGAGGVRRVRSSQSSYTLGYALHSPLDGQVGIFVRPMWVGARRRGGRVN
jgi:hypothetical protein